MKKNLFIYGLLGVSVGFNIYFVNTDVVVVNDLDDDIEVQERNIQDKVKLAQSSIQKVKIKPKNHKEENIDRIKENILAPAENTHSVKEEIEEDMTNTDYEREYQKAKVNFQHNMRAYLERDLGILPQYVDEYFQMAEDREREISQIMQSRFSDANPEEAYVFTVEDNIELANINKKYLDKLKNLLGDESYHDYVRYRNQTVKKMIQDGSGFMVEF